MSSPFVAEIRIFAGNFAPKGWALCAGQLLPISQNTALFSLLGTFYGGDGKSTFALPNLQASTPLGQGQSTTGSLPVGEPDRVLTHPQPGQTYQTVANQQVVQMAPQMISVAGGSLPHNNMMPYLALTFIIAMQGVFPPRG